MLYSMLYSSLESDFGSKEGNWKRERNWMLKFLADGMVGSQDWIVLQRRHTWDLLATMFQANRSDKSLVLSISRVGTHPTKIQSPTVLTVVP
jgi:nucleolar pre-ribosomal-associated protein 1